MPTLRTYLTRRSNVVRALKTSLIVGPLLTLINQTPVLAQLLRGEDVQPIVFVRIALTFVVPFAVSLVSAALADRARSASTTLRT